MTYSFLSRTRILFIAILFFAFILVAKLFLVQIVHSSKYTALGDRQYSTPSVNIFERGTISFSRKDGTLVSAGTQTSGFKLTINPSKLVQPEKVFADLSEIVNINKVEFLSKANKIKDPYEEVADRLTKEEADKISSLKIPGVNIFKEKWRFYPGENLASHTLGFVGYKGDELGGRYGLERQYEVVLARGKDNPYINFFAEVFSNINDKLFKDDIKRGDIVTTIEPAVQVFMEKKLLDVKNKYSAESIGGIIINPKDGSIYALGVKPDFDVNNFSKVSSVSTFSNPLVEGVLEFGSVVKPLIMAAALDTGVVTADTKYEDKGSVIVEKKEIFNFDKKARGPGTSMQDVLNQSLNTGMVYTFRKLGKQNLHDYLMSFGIKDKTGIDLPNETSGLVGNLTNNLKNIREIEYANSSFGQGIALTPMGMTRALAALGNGGNLVTPHVVKEIRYDDGTKKEMKYETTRTKISVATSQEITRMLVTVMDKSLKDGKAKFDRHSVAVKTGTAQVANSKGGGYYTDRNTHSFFGYFPAYDPEFLVFLYAVNPRGVEYASQTWADPFLDITKFLINYYEIAPDR